MRSIEIQLNCDTKSALRLIRGETDSPTGIRILRIMKDPWFWCKIEKNEIKIWPKGPKRDIWSSYIKGKFTDDEHGSTLEGKIVNDPVFRIPSWLLAVSVFSAFPSFGYFMYSFMSMGDNLAPAFLIAIVSIGITVIGIFQKISEGQEEDLEKFLRKVFEQKANSIKIT